MGIEDYGLGRIEPTDDNHIRLYSLTEATMPTRPTPVVIGINWYLTFFQPVQRGKAFYIAEPNTNWGAVVGGHAICLKQPALRDLKAWWTFYNQGSEGACVGFSESRMMSMLNRKRYNGFELYHAAQQIDEWAGDNYEGTSVRAGCDVLRDTGHWVVRAGKTKPPRLGEGIVRNRWAMSVDEIARCLSPGDQGARILNQGYVEFANSWGTAYPFTTRIPLEGLHRLLFRENGDAVIATDR